MLRNTIIVMLSLILIGLITVVTHLVIDNDILYSLWCIATCVIGMFVFEKIQDFADWVVG
jgi:hypothetical protein